MVLAGLIDLGANFQRIKEKLLSASKFVPNVEQLEINCKKVVKNGINATQISFSFEETLKHRHGKDVLSIMKKITTHFNWNDYKKALALNILNTLIRAEAIIHGTSEELVHLHEAGSIDTIFDIVGFILACQDLQLLENCTWISTPVAVGGGLLNFSHGIVSNPAPATLEILKTKEFEIVGGPVESELTTPTGASILVNLIKNNIKFYPPLIIQSIGYGAGTKDFSKIPNVLRLIQGKEPTLSPYNFEKIITIETNVDDITGELLGNTVHKIMETGFAKDVSVIPMTSKKRPGYLIQILTNYEHLMPIIQLLINELGTLGVRFFPTMRYTLNRKIVSLPIQVLNKNYNIPVKISWDSNTTIIQTKPESDEIMQLSKKTGVSMRKLLQIINKEIESKFQIGQKLNNSVDF
ncbi:MAG: nickel pincer cofactor biosynthesis protein LarC [Candidatus Helarchaeota archaeon]|nr:nickel pincer cofactor biosynthesis protein LarC [Candidatus Helarchaeota archaeon]